MMPRPDCLAASSAMRCQRSSFFSILTALATQRVQEKNTISDAPASVHFCTRKSLRSPFGRPANTVERTVGSALHGTTSMTSASASCSSVCTRRHL